MRIACDRDSVALDCLQHVFGLMRYAPRDPTASEGQAFVAELLSGQVTLGSEATSVKELARGATDAGLSASSS